MSGKNRAQGLSALISNWDEAKSALEDAYNAEGSALRESEKYMDSINGRIAQLDNHLEELASVTINSEWIKTVVSMLDTGV